MNEITFASLMTAAGAGIAGGIVTAVVSLLRTAIPQVEQVSGALLAFVLSAILYVLAAFATSVASLDQALVVFLAWLTCATSAVGTHKMIVKPAVERINAG